MVIVHEVIELGEEGKAIQGTIGLGDDDGNGTVERNDRRRGTSLRPA